MAATIDIEKTEATQSTPKINNHSDRMQEMEASLKRFFERLDRSSEKFVPADAFDELLRYINNYLLIESFSCRFRSSPILPSIDIE